MRFAPADAQSILKPSEVNATRRWKFHHDSADFFWRGQVRSLFGTAGWSSPFRRKAIASFGGSSTLTAGGLPAAPSNVSVGPTWLAGAESAASFHSVKTMLKLPLAGLPPFLSWP